MARRGRTTTFGWDWRLERRGDRVNEASLNLFQWYGAIAGVIAAFVISMDIGRRATGWAFVLFLTASVAYVVWGFLNDDGKAVAWQNVILFAINLIGIWQYLLSPKNRRKMEVVKEAVQEFEEQEKAESRA